MSRFLRLEEVWEGVLCDEDDAKTETRGAQQPKLKHREEVGGWKWVRGRLVGR